MMDTRLIVESVMKEIINEVEALEKIIENILQIENENENEICKSSSGSERCRICYDTNHIIPIIHPCNCKGTMGAVHLICLERWLEESNNNNCELCGYEFSVVRIPRYNVFQAIWVWLHSAEEEYRSHVRSLKIDILRCLVVTPLTVACSYMCMIAADSYSFAYHNSYIIMSILIIPYFIWVYLMTQYHYRIWFHWWKKKSIVKILLPKDDNLET